MPAAADDFTIGVEEEFFPGDRASRGLVELEDMAFLIVETGR